MKYVEKIEFKRDISPLNLEFKHEIIILSSG